MPAVDLVQPDTNWIYCGPWQQVDVTFNQPMDPSAASGFSIVNAETGIAPPGGLSWNDKHTVLSWNPSQRLGVQTRYTVTVDKGLKGAHGGVSAQARTAPVSLALPGYSSQALYSSTAEPILYYQTTNLPTVEFTLWPLTADEGRRLMHNFSFAYPKYNPSLPALRTWSETIRGPKDDVVLGSTSLSGGGPLGKGYYFLRTSGEYQSQFVFAVVDTVLVAKTDAANILVWALDHDSGTPLSGVTVRQAGPNTPSEAVTDANGIAMFKLAPITPGSYIDRSSVFWIDGGGRNAMMSTHWPGLNAYQFGLPGDGVRSFVGHLYTDRPIYRPGETVQWKAVIRADDDA